jgi:hypothetical protein
MTGVTTHRALAVEASFVDVEDHLNHAPSGEFRGLVVFIELIRDVAIATAHPERAGDEGHGWIELCGGEIFEYLEVLRVLLGVDCETHKKDEY